MVGLFAESGDRVRICDEVVKRFDKSALKNFGFSLSRHPGAGSVELFSGRTPEY
jgi:hypothetical protein